jgi:hypothetical protein
MELMRVLDQAAAQSGRVDQLQQIFMVTEGLNECGKRSQRGNLWPCLFNQTANSLKRWKPK